MNKANNTGEWRGKHLKEPVDGWSFPPDFLREMTHAINEESNESIEMEELEVVLLHLLKLESPSTETGQQGALITRLKNLKPFHISPYNLGDMGEIAQIIDKLKPASQPQEGQDESVKAIISDNLYNIRGSNQQGLFDTDKCDEIASFILQDILKEFTLIKK